MEEPSKSTTPRGAAHERVVDARGDFQHKAARRLVDETQAICVETLNIKGMQKSHGLAKAIADASWYGLRAKIDYKARPAGKHFVAIDRWAATSKTCSECGLRCEELPLDVREWTCSNCGTEHDRDINAACMVKHFGILQLRAGGVHVL